MRACLSLLSAAALLAGCSAPGGDSGEEMRVEQISEGQQGPAGRGIVIADSAGELEEAAGVRVPDSGEGVYICAAAGERPTGGYRVSIAGGEGAAVRVTLREPGEGEIVTQALTRPYAVALARGPALSAGELRFVDGRGEPLDWPAREA